MSAEILNHCTLCPRECGADRAHGRLGSCLAPAKLCAARASLHMWEEPCLSGERGSGTIFFSGCPLSCVFCQNSEISQSGIGFELTPKRLREIFLELEKRGAHNINLVSPTPYIPLIAEAISEAKDGGFALPFIYNSSGYEKVGSLKRLSGLIDIWLPDYKYVSSVLAARYSGVPDYPSVVLPALREMVRQQPKPCFGKGHMMKRGVIIRHLMLPGCVSDSKEVLRSIRLNFGESVYVSIMRQYTPHGELSRFPELMRPLNDEEYSELTDYAVRLGIKRGFVQEGGSIGESFIPKFDGEGICTEIQA